MATRPAAPTRARRDDVARHLAPVRRVSVKDTVIERLRGLMADQRLGPGDRVPTELELSKALGVGRSSVREAVSTLVSYGLLVRRRGDGTYITADVSNLIVRPLKFRLMLDARALKEAFEARRILEAEFAFLAAQRATAADIALIDERLASMRAVSRDPERSSEADFDFHMAIAGAAKNTVLFGVLNHISDLILRTHLTTADRRGMRPQTMAMHDRIAAAIRARAPDEARRLMIEHIDNAAQHALRRLAPRATPAPRGGKIKERG